MRDQMKSKQINPGTRNRLPPSALVGTWEEEGKAGDRTTVVYIIALRGKAIVVDGIDEIDGTKLEISSVSWDGKQLRFVSSYQPTKHRASHWLQPTAQDCAIHTTSYSDDEGTWGSKERWRKRVPADS